MAPVFDYRTLRREGTGGRLRVVVLNLAMFSQGLPRSDWTVSVTARTQAPRSTKGGTVHTSVAADVTT